MIGEWSDSAPISTPRMLVVAVSLCTEPQATAHGGQEQEPGSWLPGCIIITNSSSYHTEASTSHQTCYWSIVSNYHPCQASGTALYSYSRDEPFLTSRHIQVKSFSPLGAFSQRDWKASWIKYISHQPFTAYFIIATVDVLVEENQLVAQKPLASILYMSCTVCSGPLIWQASSELP